MGKLCENYIDRCGSCGHFTLKLTNQGRPLRIGFCNDFTSRNGNVDKKVVRLHTKKCKRYVKN